MKRAIAVVLCRTPARCLVCSLVVSLVSVRTGWDRISFLDADGCVTGLTVEGSGLASFFSGVSSHFLLR